MRKYILIFALMLAVVSCSKKITIEGNLSDAPNQVIKIEKLETTETFSAETKTNAKGKFKIRIPAADAPDFYSLKVENQSLVLGVDSLTDRIIIEGNAANLLNCDITGSDESVKIQTLRQMCAQIQKAAEEKDIDKTTALIEEHKSVAQNIIMESTHSVAAYYAIHQRISGYYFFNPYDKSDLKFWAAVATAYELYYPNSWRTNLLKQTTLQAMSAQKRTPTTIQDLLAAAGQDSFIDITLPNRLGAQISLSQSLGKVVLLDFVAAELDNYPAHVLLLKELYYKYNELGFEIFQVSFDRDKVLWLEKTRALPWVNVRDEQSLNSKWLKAYNISELPTLFLMNREGEIIGRYTQNEIEEALESQF